MNFDQWIESQRDPIHGSLDVDLPEEKALHFARTVWKAATNAAAARLRFLENSPCCGDADGYMRAINEGESAIRSNQ